MYHRLMLVSALATLSCAHAPAQAPVAEGRSLFNGQSLAGWQTYLGIPHSSVEGLALPRDDKGNYNTPIGLDIDPKQTFSVSTLDGQPVIRISGEILGSLVTVEEFEDVHIRLEYRWGDKRWQPRLDQPRDSGLLYYSVGPHGAGSNAWMASLECQIQEGDTGDFWSVAKLKIDAEAEPFIDNEKRNVLRYLPGGKIYTRFEDGSLSRISKLSTHEQTGWNVVEVEAVGGQIVHVVNGHVVLRLSNPRRMVDGVAVPLRRGKIQLQSEFAEVFYRNITVRPIKEIDPKYR